LTVNGVTTGTISGEAAVTDTAANILSALNLNPSLAGKVKVLASGTANFRLIFVDSLGLLDIPLTVSGTTTAGTGGVITGTQVTPGGTAAINGALQVGDNSGGSASARVNLIQSNQIANLATIAIGTDGRFDLNGQSETLGAYAAATTALTLNVGETSSGEIVIGTGNLTLQGSTTAASVANVAVNVRPGTSALTAPAAAITSTTGSLTLAGGTAGQASTFTVNDGPGETELLVSARVAGSLNAGLTKAGTGRMTLSGNNTYTGTTTVSAGGVLRAASSNALGTGTGRNEVQTLTITGTPTFTLAYSGVATGNLTATSTALAIQTALEGILGAGNVIVSGAVGGPFDITFQGALANAGVSTLLSSVATGTNNAVITTPTAGIGGTVVAAGAALELAGDVSINNEYLGLGGTGLINAPITALSTSAVGTGALRSVDGENVWNGTVVLNGANGATSGIAADSGKLTVSGAINQQIANTDQTNVLVKTGAGILEMAGATNNNYRGATWLNEGTLLLNKSGAAIAIRATLTVGDGIGGDNVDVLRYAPGSGTAQIGNVAVRVNSSGVFDLAGNTDAIDAAITLVMGPDSAADFLTNGASFLLNTLQVSVMAGTTGSSPAATFQGLLNLNGGERVLTVNRSGNTNNLAHELDVQALVNNGGLRKQGQGTVRLSNSANNYTGTTSVLDGRLIVGADGALGAFAGATLVAEGASIVFPGGINVTTTELLAISGSGFEGLGAIQNTGVNSYAGNVLAFEGARTTHTLVNLIGGALTLGGSVALSNATLEVIGAGDLTILGAVTGNANGDTVVNGFEEWFFDLAIGTVNGDINRVLATPSNVRKLLTGRINFPDDASLIAEAGVDVNGLTTDLTAVWVTELHSGHLRLLAVPHEWKHR